MGTAKWVRNFTKRTHGTERNTAPKYTISKVPHARATLCNENQQRQVPSSNVTHPNVSSDKARASVVSNPTLLSYRTPFSSQIAGYKNTNTLKFLNLIDTRQQRDKPF